MNVAKIISSLTIGLGKAVTRAAAASGSQMVKNFNYKPEGMDQSSSSSSSASAKAGSKVAAIQQQMSIDEAHMILNVKKEDPMEIIQKHYDAIFAANGPPPEPKTPTPTPTTPPASKVGPKRKPPSHSHYLQSKVYRALERIKAERGQLDQEPPAEGGEAGAKDPAVAAAEALGAAGARAAEQAKETRT